MAALSSKHPLHLDMLFQSLNREPVNLLGNNKYTRADLIFEFFPDLACEIDSGESKSKADAVIESLPEGERTFCFACCRIDEVFKNYLNYFFTAQREKSTFCRNLFISLFNAKSDPLVFMAEKSAKVLKKAGLLDLPVEDLRNRALMNTLENAMSAISERVPEFSIPKELIIRDIQDSLAMGLAKVIASYAVYLDVSSFKNDRKRIFMQKQLLDLLFAIWKIHPEDIAWQTDISRGIQAFCSGNYMEAHALFSQAEQLLQEEDRRSNYATASYADLLSYQAHMLLDGSCGERSFSKAYRLIHKACSIRATNGDDIFAPRRFYESAFYQLFHPDEWLQQGGADPKAGFLPVLQKASDENCIDAIILLADLLITGSNGCDHLKDQAKGIQLLEYGASLANVTVEERAKCELKLAEYHLQCSAIRQADLHYEKAARLGSYHAIVHLREKHFCPDVQIVVQIPLQAHHRICVFNSHPGCGDMNDVFRLSLDEKWMQCSDNILNVLYHKPEILQYAQIVFAFLSNDEHQNLSDALETLKLLNAVAYQQKEKARIAFIERVDILVLSRNSASKMMIDSAMSQLAKGVYFRIRICDPEMIAANELLMHHPTFLPCIDAQGQVKEEKWKHQKKGERCQRRIVILGTSGYAKAVVRQIVATTYLEEYPTQLTVIGPDALHLEAEMQEEYPGLFASDTAPHITPQFRCCVLECLPIIHAGTEPELHALLHNAHYFVVATTDDMDNIALAIKLRTGLIKAHMPHGMQPLITVLYRDSRTQWVASQISVGARSVHERYHWTENYNLRFFGSADSFRIENLLNNSLQKCALSIHKSYYHLGEDTENDQKAMSDYYRRSYNRDSSLCLAVGMIYHCFGMGVYHSQVENYTAETYAALLGQQYHEILSKPEMQVIDYTEKAARIEHSRWNGWCLSRGWTKPEDHVLVTYMQMQNPKHHLEIGKLHPYITAYDQLIQECAKLNELITIYQHNKRILPDPRISDRELTRQIPYFLTLFIQNKLDH